MSGSQLTPVSNSGGFTGLRKKSARNANKMDDVELPTNYLFLVYFNCDNKISVLKPGHGSWPNHLTNSMKLSLKREDLPFRSDKKPNEFINGLLITSGPSKTLERVAVLMTVKLKKGMAPTDMNLKQEFEDARQEIETEKQQEKENNQSLIRGQLRLGWYDQRLFSSVTVWSEVTSGLHLNLGIFEIFRDVGWVLGGISEPGTVPKFWFFLVYESRRLDLIDIFNSYLNVL